MPKFFCDGACPLKRYLLKRGNNIFTIKAGFPSFVRVEGNRQNLLSEFLLQDLEALKDQLPMW